MSKKKKSTPYTPSISDHVTLHLIIQTQIDALQCERKMIKDQFFVTPNMHRSYTSVDEPFFLSCNKDFLLQQLWYHAGYSVQTFRTLLLKAENSRAQRIYDLCQALLSLTPMPVQRIQPPIPRKIEVPEQEKAYPNLVAKGEQWQKDLKTASKGTKVRQDEMTITLKQGNVGSTELETKPDTNKVAKITRRELQRLREGRKIDTAVWYSSLDSEAHLGCAMELKPGGFTTSGTFLQITKDNAEPLVAERDSSSSASDGDSGYCESHNSTEESTISTRVVAKDEEHKNQESGLEVIGEDEKAICEHEDMFYGLPHWRESGGQLGSTARGTTNHDIKQFTFAVGRQPRPAPQGWSTAEKVCVIVCVIILFNVVMMVYCVCEFLVNKLF